MSSQTMQYDEPDGATASAAVATSSSLSAIDDTVLDLAETNGLLNLIINSQQQADSCHNAMESPTVEEKGEIDVKVVTKDLRRQNSSFMTEMPSYKMESKPRGLALIVEIETYVNDVQEKRIGSHHDVDNLTRLFEQLYFKVEVERNPRKQELDRILERFAADPGHLVGDMMILAILSHGREGHVFAADGRQLHTESIYERFNNLNCPALKGKPKFFIVQACRGDETDTGLEEHDEEAARDIPRKRRAGTDRDTIPFGNYAQTLNKARPTWEDMIIAYSTIPGFTSIRDHDGGTWFIQSLVETFMNHSFERELIDLLRMTSEYLSGFTNEQNEKQTCNIELRHLYKRIYFNPGLSKTTTTTTTSAALTSIAATPHRVFLRSKSTPPPSPRTMDDEED